MRRALVPGFLLSTLVACTDRATPDGSPATGVSAGADAGAATAIGAGAAAAATGGIISGTVQEQIPVGPYVYVRLATADGELWAAVNQAPLAVGDTVTVHNTMLMEQFQSPTLNRTFARIYFGSLEPAGAPAGGRAPGGATMGAGGEPVGTPPVVNANVGVIARATGTNAKVIGEVWAARSHLAGGTVSVRGVVVKYNPGVMGKNWLHLQDGSGRAADGTNDLAVTSTDVVSVGDTVTVTGTVRLDRDFGAGYTYPLLLEDARVAKGGR